MDKFLIGALLAFAALPGQAAEHCKAYQDKARYLNAIEKVGSTLGMSLEQVCSSERWLAVEAQPSRKINRDGEIVPHVAVQLHFSYDSCLYMVRDSDLSITEQRCYSGF